MAEWVAARSAVAVCACRPWANMDSCEPLRAGMGYQLLMDFGELAGATAAWLLPQDMEVIGQGEVLVLRNETPFDAETVSWCSSPAVFRTPFVRCPAYAAPRGIDLTPLLDRQPAKPDFGLTMACEGAALAMPRTGLALWVQREEIEPNRIIRAGYLERTWDITGEGRLLTPEIDLRDASTVTWFLQNRGTAPVQAIIQSGPDGDQFLDNSGPVRVEPDGMGALVPYVFARYARVAVDSPGQMARIRVYAQLQLRSYGVGRAEIAP